MKGPAVAAVFLHASALYGAYSYYQSDNFATIDPAKWDQDVYGVLVSKVPRSEERRVGKECRL